MFNTVLSHGGHEVHQRSDHTVVARPSLTTGVRLYIKGRTKAAVIDKLQDDFFNALTLKVDES